MGRLRQRISPKSGLVQGWESEWSRWWGTLNSQKEYINVRVPLTENRNILSNFLQLEIWNCHVMFLECYCAHIQFSTNRFPNVLRFSKLICSEIAHGFFVSHSELLGVSEARKFV